MTCVRCGVGLVGDMWYALELSLCMHCYSRSFSEVIDRLHDKRKGGESDSVAAEQGSEFSLSEFTFDVWSAAKTLPSFEFESSTSSETAEEENNFSDAEDDPLKIGHLPRILEDSSEEDSE